MCKTAGRPVMVGMDRQAHRALVFRPDCKMWSCPDCAVALRELWTARVAFGARAIIDGGGELKFLTITSHERLSTFSACYAVFPDAWAKLYAAMKRIHPSMAYALIPEKHQDGRMHAHILTDCPVTKRWLKDNARKRGLGYQADAQPVDGVGHAAAYCSKYLGKGLGDELLPAHFRRIRLSQNWAKLPELHEPADGLDWLACRSPAALWAACEECQRERLNMIDLRTGEVFDILDFIERIEAEGRDVDAQPIN